MRINAIARAILFIALATVTTFAADIAGKWKTTMTTPNGDKREGTLDLKVDGNKLTGTMGGARGTVEIQDGKVDGDKISFVVVRKFQDNEMKLPYTGVVTGDDMKLTVSFNGNEMEMSAKRDK